MTPRPPRTPAPDSVAAEGDVALVPDKRDGREDVENKGAAPPPPAPSAPSAPQTVKGGRPSVNQGLQIADDKDSLGAGRSAPAVIDSSSGAGERVQVTGQPRGPTVGQLAKQSETAASRGDCAAVRAIVARIRKLDEAFHKSHVEKNAAVKRCVK